jgi:Galactose-1-phosphate uridyl transferase, C-terminal domain
MGCSNPHPHGQAWSLSEIPSIPATEIASLRRYALNTSPSSSNTPRGPSERPCLLCDYAHLELGVTSDEGRVVTQNEHWVAVVPWWATWPYEILCMSCRTELLLSLTRPKYFHTIVTFHHFWICNHLRSLRSPASFQQSQKDMTIFIPVHSRTPWEFISDQCHLGLKVQYITKSRMMTRMMISIIFIFTSSLHYYEAQV